MDQQQGPTIYSTGHYVQYTVLNHNGKEYERVCVCVYIYMHVRIYLYVNIYIYVHI